MKPRSHDEVFPGLRVKVFSFIYGATLGTISRVTDEFKNKNHIYKLYYIADWDKKEYLTSLQNIEVLEPQKSFGKKR